MKSASRRKQPLEKPILPKKIAAVTWEDAWYDDEVHTEQSLQEEAQSCLLYSVGFLIRDDEAVVTLAMDFGNGTCRHVQRIRKENIRKLDILD